MYRFSGSRHERLGGDHSRPFAQERSCALLALDDRVLDMRRRAINRALVVERTASAVRKAQSLSGQAVAQGALADLLLFEGSPLQNINLIADRLTNFKIIMKGGIIYKDMLTK